MVLVEIVVATVVAATLVVTVVVVVKVAIVEVVAVAWTTSYTWLYPLRDTPAGSLRVSAQDEHLHSSHQKQRPYRVDRPELT